MKFEKLLTPGKIANLELKNRFVVLPIGTNLGSSDGYVTDDMIEYYRRRAAGGFGLVIIEVVAVDRKGRAITNQVVLWDDSQIPKCDMKCIPDEVKFLCLSSERYAVKLRHIHLLLC